VSLLSNFCAHSTAVETLDSVTDRGSITTNGITIGNLTSTGIDDNATSTALTIDSSGNLLVGTTSAVSDVGGLSVDATGSLHCASFQAGGDGYGIVLRNSGGTTVGTIVMGASATTYNTSSDYRLKENVVNLDNATDRLKQIPVHRFNFIADPDTTVDGFIAHEVQDVVPEAITGTKDAVDAEGNPEYQNIDQSKLVPLLTAALKEAVAKIEDLESRLSALEAPTP